MARYRRIGLSVIPKNKQRADQLVSLLTTQVQLADMWTGDDGVYKKNDRVRQWVDEGGTTWVSATYLFLNEAKASAVFSNLKTNLAAYVLSGTVSVHWCPEEGTVKDWQGCKDDPRALYEEVVI